ncbi:hypothetical protein BDZ94DRAFT_323046 [Collybia nuda]|uniref:DUF6533 domain-containing protein n=1 Tax=Collybia nuda TaxID=64659 RepID=A0A9P5YB89_9AGAR|nr:hypothetical protein BDZ94DRAFT_323046 [Collybia nuda]
MSSIVLTSAQLEELAGCVLSITQARYAMIAVYCLQIYEWLATSEKEVNLIHRARWTSVKVAYLLCRYYPLFLWPVITWAYVGNHDEDVCQNVMRPIHVLLAPCQVFPQGVMLMRAYAFSGRNKKVLLLLCICYAGLIGVDIWVFCTHIAVPPTIFYLALGKTGCFPDYGDGFMALRIGYSMLAATLMDLASLSVVIVHCYRTRGREISLGRYFVNQGLGAFGFVSAVNIATAATFFDFKNGIGLPFILVVSNLIACRVILQLRRKVTPSDSEISRRHSMLVRNAFGPHPSDDWLMEDHR